MPMRKRLITHDVTQEKLHELQSVNPAGIGVVRDELAGWFATLDKYGREGERAYYLTGWAGDSTYTMDRIGRGSFTAIDCISLLGAITPGRLKNYLADTLADGPTNDGLLQRFQLAIYPDMLPEERHVDIKADLDALIEAKNMYALLATLNPTDSLHFRFADDAQQVYRDWDTQLGKKLRSHGMHPAMISHLAKYRSLMPSLALLFELADRATTAKILPQFKNTYYTNPLVSLEHTQQAAAWCEYLESHARRIYAMIISPERTAAAEVARHLVEGWKRTNATFTVRDVYNNGWAGLDTADKARRGIEILVDAGWVRRVQLGERSGAGRPSEVYAINPRVQGKTNNKLVN